MQKVLLMQGLPGSGKSFHAKRLARENDAMIASADEFPGLYGPGNPPSFNPALLGSAHGWCFGSTIEAVRSGRSVVVDNTNTTALEIAPYYALAQAFGATVVLARVECDPEVAFQRNTHGVPRPAHEAMARRLAEFQPPVYWTIVRLTIPN